MRKVLVIPPAWRHNRFVRDYSFV